MISAGRAAFFGKCLAVTVAVLSAYTAVAEALTRFAAGLPMSVTSVPVLLVVGAIAVGLASGRR